jgi:ABC-2 type transport system ATP-binding protein
MGKTIFFSTHILADVAEICSKVGIIEAGKLVAHGSLEELHLQILPLRRVEITLLGQAQAAKELLEAFMGVTSVESLPTQGDSQRERLSFEFSGDDNALQGLLANLVSQEIPVLHFSEDNRDLEEVFLRATKGLVT